MIRTILWLSQALVVAPAVYSAAVSLFGLTRPKMAGPAANPTIRFRIVIPAHNEEAVIAGIASDVAAQRYPKTALRSVVIDDRSTDATASIASNHIEVTNRHSGPPTKGDAIAWYLEGDPIEPDEVLIVLDADNRINDTYVACVAARFEAGCDVLQTYLDVTNADGSPLATANALTYWASNRMVQLARSRLGWSCDLGGTGMAITGRALAAAGGFTSDLADDLSLNVRLNLTGHTTEWEHTVRVRDEKPTRTADAVVQRARWVRGRRQVSRKYLGRLVGQGFARRRWALLDLAYRLVHPGRSLIALILGLFTVAAVLWPDAGWWPAWSLASVTAVVVLLPMLFLAVEGVGLRYIVRYPYVTLIALLWIPVRIASRAVPGWRRTTHRGL